MHLFRRIAPSVAVLGCLSLQAAEENLLLKDTYVPWTELGHDFIDRPAPVTEVIEDLVFKSNRERKKIIAARNLSGEDLEAPDRKTLFGANPFLGRGSISPGFRIPTGAVWQPVTVIYGEARTAVQAFDNGLVNVNQWANRLDIFGNIYLTPTERINFGFRPLDRDNRFSGYRFGGDGSENFMDHFNGNLRSLYFEGDFGELFPNLDPEDKNSLDYGFAVGRMPISYQDGLLVNDVLDGVGITRASLFLFGASAARLTAFYAWDQIHRGSNARDPDAKLYALSYAADYTASTYEVEVVYVDGGNASGGDGVFAGIGQTRRFGKLNSTLRAAFSWALDQETAAIGTGSIFFHQLSRTMNYNDDIAYLDTFLSVDNFTSAARDPAAGGPLGATGILFEAVGLGGYGAALGNTTSTGSVGFGLGYQHFFDEEKKSQLVAEIGARWHTQSPGRSGYALGLRYQRALDQHTILRADGFIGQFDDGETGQGLRCELSFRF
ncbi:MAG: hypothetical protein R3F13_00425 [Prosthecobacter sp.]